MFIVRQRKVAEKVYMRLMPAPSFKAEVKRQHDVQAKNDKTRMGRRNVVGCVVFFERPEALAVNPARASEV